MKYVGLWIALAGVVSCKDANGGDFNEPEYVADRTPHAKKPATPVAAETTSKDVLANLESVTDYADDKDIQDINANAPPAALLQVGTEVHQTNEMSADSRFMDAHLVEDLDKDMRTRKPGEKFVGPKIQSKLVEHSIKTDEHRPLEPEIAPQDMPEDMRSVFNEMASKYEKRFQEHFADGLPHPNSYLEVESGNQQSEHNKQFKFKHVVFPEPQILLPVPANLLYGVALSEYQRDQMLQNAMQHSKTVNEAPGSLMEVEATTMPNQAASDSDYIDPYSFVTPATIAQGAGHMNGMFYTPTSVAQGAAMNAGLAGPMPLSNNFAFGAATPGMPNGFMPAAPLTAGVQAPPPPLRPDNLPPPPYIRPQPQPGAGTEAGEALAENSADSVV